MTNTGNAGSAKSRLRSMIESGNQLGSNFEVFSGSRMNNYRPSLLLLLVLLTILGVWGCARQSAGPVYIKNGKEYGKISGYFFRHRWWNYYERGLSFMEGEFYPQALTDFAEAIKQRPRDQRMARTYGMHFIDYFPHRELGIVHYQRGNFKAARKELELSLNQFPTAKARFYLDRVRKALIQRESKKMAPPSLTLNFQRDEIWTRDDPVVLSGVAEDQQYVAGISIDGVPLFLEGSQKDIAFEKPLALSQGRHVIAVAAKNLFDMATEHRVIIHVDRAGPLIILDEVKTKKTLQGQEITLYGSAYDQAGVVGLRLNDQPIPIDKGREIQFIAKRMVDKAGLKLMARDRLGNETSALIPLNSRSDKTGHVLLACGGATWQGLLVAGLFGPEDTQPPSIKLKGWTEEQIVYQQKVYIEGQVWDENKIVNLAINGIPLLPRPCRMVFFNHIAELKKGENKITIEAGDEGGQTASMQITIIRQIPKALQLAQRMSLTVLPFEQQGKLEETGLVFQNNLTDALVNRNRFRVVERDKLDMILQEQKLSRLELFDQRTAIKLGRLVAAQSLIAGNIAETRAGIEVVGRMVDTETSEILASVDVYDEVKDLFALRPLAEGMAIKLHREFPVVDGLIIKRKQAHIFTDLGKDVIKLHRRLIVFRAEPIVHPMTGKAIGADNIIIGRARITQVMPEMSKAELVDGKIEAITLLDRVITE